MSATRDRIQRVALELFDRQGYDNTSVTQVAEAAGLSHMTVFRHFATKQALVLDDPFDPQIADVIAAQSLALTPIRRACAGFRQALASIDLPPGDDLRRRLRIAATSPTLRSATVASAEASQHAVMVALICADVTEDQARVAAAAVIAGLSAALTGWAVADTSVTFADAALAALDVLDPS